MKYVVALIACGGLFLLYAVIGALLGWRHGGGIIPMMILLSVIGASWAAITRVSSADKTRNNTPPTPPPPPFAGFQDIPKEPVKKDAAKKMLSNGSQ